MCSSTPTSNNNNNTTGAGECSSKCSLKTTTTASAPVQAPKKCSAQSDDGTCNSLKLRSTPKSFECTTSNTEETSKEILADNLGYNEENAVYKEIINSTHFENKNSNLNGKKLNENVIYNPKIRWPDLIAQLFLHVGGLYGFYLLFTATFSTFLWVIITIWASGIGITAGAHRLWSHKSYTASLPLRILLIFLFTIAGQRDAYTWALDHRIHHKFSETEADPHNAKRGFFFAHVGWLFITPHPKVEEKRKVIDMSDLENDAVVMFQRKWFIPLFAICSIALPVLVPWYCWQEPLWSSFWINFNMRFCCTLNIAFFVNSVAHMYGRKPYDKSIMPVECPIVSFLALGEGWHNYHHVFPWDYKTGEFGNYRLNVTTAFIDGCAKLGLVKARKVVSVDMVNRRALKCGDGTRFLSDEFAHCDQVWGYGDRDILKEDAEELAKMT